MDDDFFRNVLEPLWPPITVVTVASGSKRSAFLAASVIGASFGPPNPLRVTIQLMKQTYSYQLVQEKQAFAIHLFSQDQTDILKSLAGPGRDRDRDKLVSIPYKTGVTGSPLLEGAVAYLDCRVVNSMDAGDRTVCLADVVDGRRLRQGELLTYDYYQAMVAPELMAENAASMAPLRSVWADLAPNVQRGS